MDGANHTEEKFEMAKNANVQDLIDAVLQKCGRNLNRAKVDEIKVLDTDFNEWATLTKPYDDIILNQQHRYSISIVDNEISKADSTSLIQPHINAEDTSSSDYTTNPIEIGNLIRENLLLSNENHPDVQDKCMVKKLMLTFTNLLSKAVN